MTEEDALTELISLAIKGARQNKIEEGLVDFKCATDAVVEVLDLCEIAGIIKVEEE